MVVRPKVCVVGSGVIGLATALHLQEQGFSVEVFTDPSRYRLTSLVAAAFWYPFAVDGGPELEKLLAEPTLDLLETLIDDPSSGVWMVEARQYFDATVGPTGRPVPWWTGREELAFRTLREDELPTLDSEELGRLAGGWGLRLPAVHMATFLAWLTVQFCNKGGVVLQQNVKSLTQFRRQGYAAVVNCSGGWATRLTNAHFLHGLQGVVVHVDRRYAGNQLVFMEHGQCEHRPVYIVPHRDQRTVLGGTVRKVTSDGAKWKPNDARLWTPSLEDVDAILRRCSLIEPGLRELIGRPEKYEAFAGLRPRRTDHPPRIEIDEGVSTKDCLVVHNYGHGGAGLTMCWGSAAYVLGLLRDRLG